MKDGGTIAINALFISLIGIAVLFMITAVLAFFDLMRYYIEACIFVSIVALILIPIFVSFRAEGSDILTLLVMVSASSFVPLVSFYLIYVPLMEDNAGTTAGLLLLLPVILLCPIVIFFLNKKIMRTRKQDA